jgi:histidinol-phosphate aminotransferase
VVAALHGLGWPVPYGQANFVWLRADGDRQRDLVAAFDDADVLVRAYPGDGIRITLADRTTNDRVISVLGNRRLPR